MLQIYKAQTVLWTCVVGGAQNTLDSAQNSLFKSDMKHKTNSLYNIATWTFFFPIMNKP